MYILAGRGESILLLKDVIRPFSVVYEVQQRDIYPAAYLTRIVVESDGGVLGKGSCND